MKGAGGSSGGIGQFFIGFVMMCGGLYMLFSAIHVQSNFGMGARIMGFSAFGGSYGITSGMIMIPFIFGIGFIFYNAKNPLGWLLSIGSMTGLVFGVISTIQFSFRSMTAFDLIVILTLSAGGLGLFLNSLRNMEQ